MSGFALEVLAGRSGATLGPFAVGPLDSAEGIGAILFVVGAAVLVGFTELLIRRARRRAEGRELLAALRASRAPPPTSPPAEST